MTALEIERAAEAAMQRWCAEYAEHPRVKLWLRQCPPPAQWQGTPAQWAYTEMPFPPSWGK